MTMPDLTLALIRASIFFNSLFDKINEIKQNVNRSEDLTIAVGKSDYIGSMYGSYKGTFPSIFKLNLVSL
jgi:hypothetical protein